MVLNGIFEDIMIFFIKDIGVVKFVILKRIYDNIVKILEKFLMLMIVNGDLFVEFGKIFFKIKFSNVELSFEFIVVDIYDDGLIGIDFLMYNDIGEVEINLKVIFLELGYERILIIRVRLFLLVLKVFFGR